MNDSHDLQRFVTAQASVYDDVLAELGAGRKTSHWMWFVFPQIQGLGSSPMAARYAIASLAEARAYLDHPILGTRLRQCSELVLQAQGRTAEQIFGNPDVMKLRSSMTLFDRASGEDGNPFARVLERHYDGKRDEATLARL